MRSSILIGIGAILYILLIVAVMWTLWEARRQMLVTYAAADEQTHWEEFREAMDTRHQQREELREKIAEESGQPVQAAPPKVRSQRPPTLELLQNHFAACLTVSLLGVTLLFAIIWGFLMGAILRPGRRYEDLDENDNAAKTLN